MSDFSWEGHGRLGSHRHEKMKYLIDVEERAIATNSAAVQSTIMARKHREEDLDRRPDPIWCSGIRSNETRLCRSLREGMTQVSIDDLQQFVCEVVDGKLEEEYTEETSESAGQWHDTENHDDFAWCGVNYCKLNPARVREARRTEME